MEGGTFYIGAPKHTNYLKYFTNPYGKYLLKITSLFVDGEKIEGNFYGTIDSGSENFSLPSEKWKELGSPDEANVDITFTGVNDKSYNIKNKTFMRPYDPSSIELDNGDVVNYLLISKFVLQNTEVTYDVKNKQIGFK